MEEDSNDASSTNSDKNGSSGSEVDDSEPKKKIRKSKISFIIGVNTDKIIECASPKCKFYVKYRDKPYIKCKWIDYSKLIKDVLGRTILTKFKNKCTELRPVDFVENLFKPDSINFEKSFITPELILKIDLSKEKPYLIKWGNLPISDSTWMDTADQELIDSYIYFRNRKNRVKFTYQVENVEYEMISNDTQWKNDNKLRSYQIEAVNWLFFNWCNGRNSLLADEMGLGKTIDAVCFFEVLRRRLNINGPFLVVAPLSTLQNWNNEIQAWTDFQSLIFFGDEKSRSRLKKYCIFGEPGYTFLDVIVVSYETMSIEFPFLNEFEFPTIVFDEAHRMKNPTTNYTQKGSLLKSYNTILMTGTPIQNNITELWSMLHLLSPTQFTDMDGFVRAFSSTKDTTTVSLLQDLLKPFILRRTKSSVEIELAPKDEILIEVELTQIQMTLYQLVFDDNREMLVSMTKGAIQLRNVMMELRKICNHPYLVPNFEELCVNNYMEQKNIGIKTEGVENEALVFSSGKMILLDKLLPKLKENKSKVLIFSQMTAVLDVLEDYITYKQYKYERLDGSVSFNNRTKSIQRFTNDEDIFIFLLCTKAGGLGINLTAADTVIIFDSDWNPQNDIQAQSRCHRIGQNKEVKVYRLITKGTYEAEMYERASLKLGLSYALLDAPADDKTTEELDIILKKGAYFAFKGDTDIDNFCEEDIDQILEKRTRVIHHDFIAGGKSTFSTVSFISKDDTINFKDVDFWSNLLPEVRDNDNFARRRNTKKDSTSVTENEEEEEDESVPSERYVSINSSEDEMTEQLDVDGIDVPKEKIMEIGKRISEVGTQCSVHFFIEEDPNYSFVARAIVASVFYLIDDERKYEFRNYVDRILDEVDKAVMNATLDLPIYADECFIEMFAPNPVKFLIDAMKMDIIFNIALYMDNDELPEDYHIAASQYTPPYWTPKNDYEILYYSCIYGIDNIIQYPISIPFSVACQWIEDRRLIMAFEIAAYMPKNYSPPQYKLSPPDELERRSLKMFSLKTVTKFQYRQLLQCLFMFGFDVTANENVFYELQESSHLTYIRMDSFKYYVIGIIQAAGEMIEELSLQDLDKIPIPPVQDIITFKIAQSLDILVRLRTLMERDPPPVPFECDRWGIAPNWWTPSHDYELLWVTARYGFSTLGEFLYTMQQQHISNDEIERIRRYEKAICAQVENNTSLRHLYFMRNIDLRRERLYYIAGVYEDALDHPEINYRVYPKLPSKKGVND